MNRYLLLPLALAALITIPPIFAQQRSSEPPEELEPFEARGDLTDAMLNQKAQLEAAALQNIVSGKDLRNINDQDAAEVINRISGLSVNTDDGVASGVVVRGIQPDLNKITVDGQNLGGRRGRGAGALNQVAPEFVESIEVTKAPTPDMDADVIGGTINLSTTIASSLENRIFSGRVSSTYDDAGGTWSHTGNVSYGQPLDTERPSGFMISLNLQERAFERNRYGTRFGAAEFDEIGGFETSVYTRNSQGFGLSGSYDIQLSDATRVFVKATGNSSNRQFERTRIVRELRRAANQVVAGQSASYTDFDSNQNGFEVDRDIVTATGLIGIEYKDDLWEIDAAIGASLESEESNNQTSVAFATDSIFSGTYDISEDPFAPRFTVTGADENDPALYDFSRVADIEQTEDETEWVAEIDAQRTFDLAIGDLALKVGAKRVDRAAESNEDRLQYALAPGALLTLESFADPSGNFVNGYGLGPGIDSLGVSTFRAVNPDLFVVNESRTFLASFTEDYDVSETITAAYGMATLTHGPLRWIAGVRMEHTETEASGFVIDESDFSNLTPITAERDYTHWLPGVHVRYVPNVYFAARASATQTIARPGFRDISPYRNIDEGDREISSGAPDLQPYESDNLDLTFDFLVPKFGAIQAGVFYKEIDNFIVEVTRDITFEGQAYQEEIEVNGDTAELVGFELAWQNEFVWLPAPFDTLETDVSYTWTSSEATVLDPVRVVRMSDQAEHTFKASAEISLDKWTFDVAVDYRSHRMDELVRAGFDEFDSEEFSLDLGASYAFNKAWSVNLGLRNATGFDRTSYFGSEDRLGRTWDSSWRGTVGVRWKL